MQITAANLEALRKNFNAAFKEGMGMAEPQASIFSTEIPSAGSEEVMGWLSGFPTVREWMGDRQVKSMGENAYAIKNKKWENTIGVKRDHIDDDTFGIYAPMFKELGRTGIEHRETLLTSALASGFTTKCFDGQNFFDTDHVRLNKEQQAVTYSNMQAGAGKPWFLLSCSRVIKPIVWTNRRDWNLVAKDKDTDTNVFMRDEYLYGADARYNVGYGFPQLAFASKAELTPENYAAARAAMGSQLGDNDRVLGIMPTHLVVDPTLEGKARKLLNNDYAAGGETNEWQGSAKLLVSPWLAAA